MNLKLERNLGDEGFSRGIFRAILFFLKKKFIMTFLKRDQLQNDDLLTKNRHNRNTWKDAYLND